MEAIKFLTTCAFVEDKAAQIYQAMASAARAQNEKEALRMAVEAEQQFVKVHVNNAVHFYKQRIAALIEELGAQDQAHLDRLRSCLKWWHSERKPNLRKC